MAKLPNCAIDIESNALRPWNIPDPKIWLCAIGTYERTIAFGLDHPECWGTDARRKKAWALLGEFLLKSGRKKAHNLGMEQEWFGYFFGDRVLRLTEWDDTMAMAFVLDEREGTKSLGVQTRMEFGFNLKDQSRVDPKRLLEYPLQDAMRYNGMDTKWTDLLGRRLLPRIQADEKFLRVYEQKVRTSPTLVIMEAKGLPVDFTYAEGQAKQLLAEMTSIEAKIRRCPEVQKYKERFGTFSVTNADHALTLMRDICKRDEVQQENRDGSVRWTSDEEALSAIPANEVPSARFILEHRAAAKLYSTYIEPLIGGKIVSRDGLIHAKYSSMRTVTGRLAAEDPNMQNWPKRKRKEVRGVICAPDGTWIIACDYGQIEFRVVGMASEDEVILKACWTGYDVHMDWAERLVKRFGRIKDLLVDEFEIDWDEKGMKTLRQEMKNKWVFPQLFGSSTRSCAAQLHLPEDVADDLGADFWDVFRGTKKWQEKLLKSYEKNLYVETLCGQRRRGPMTKNEIINMPIQGTAAEIVIEGMNALSEHAFVIGDPTIAPSLNVHDDLSTISADKGMEQRIEVIAHEMCKPRFEFINVPLIVEVSIGKRWHELEEIGKYSSAKLFNLENPYA
jgi:DNA polymerase I-like protein with 3'-5' exonuclease and polymerase domains